MPIIEKPSVAHKSILKIEAYKAGASSVYGIDNPIKLSSNENPFGASIASVIAIKEAAEKTNRYPDGSCIKLRNTIAERYSIKADNIVCGAGSDELIALLCQAYAGIGDEIIYSEHGFLMYPISAIRVGATPIMARENNLKTSIDSILSCVTDNTKIVFIANPNNPTGSYLTKDEMRVLRHSLPDNVLLVIDAAYGEYVDKQDYSTGLYLAEETNNTVTTRTFSKIYGLSSLRLGWAYCPSDIADILNRTRGPFNVSDIAQKAGIAAICDTEFIEKSKEHNRKWLAIVSEKLQNIGLFPYPSIANFILVEFPPENNAQKADEFLRKNGIIGRRMESYGLPNCMRFTIGLEDENNALITTLSEFITLP